MMANLSLGIDNDLLVISGQLVDNSILYPYVLPNVVGHRVKVLAKNNLDNFVNNEFNLTDDDSVIQSVHVYHQNNNNNYRFYLISNLPTEGGYELFTVDKVSLHVESIGTYPWDNIPLKTGTPASQPGTATKLATRLGNITSAVYRDLAIWCCLTSGNKENTSTIYWYQISVLEEPLIVQSGLIEEPGAWCYNGSIAVNSFDDFVIQYSISATDKNTRMKIAYRHRRDNLGTITHSEDIAYLNKDQDNPYYLSLHPVIPWGISSAAVDPDNPEVFLVSNQMPYTSNGIYSCFWSTQISKILTNPSQLNK